MSVTDLSFLFAFLPFSIICYHISKLNKFKHNILFALNILFYLLASQYYLLLILALMKHKSCLWRGFWEAI